MPIRRTTPDTAIDQYLDRKASMIRAALINNLIYVGEQAVTEARQRGKYKDRTGNLRSSIGYCVLDNGKVVKRSSFETVKQGQQGSGEGNKFLSRLISEHSAGLVLIVVAGMEYAAYVEAKNLNVLDSAEQLARQELPQLLKALNL